MSDPNFSLETPRLYISQFRPSSDVHCQFTLNLYNSPRNMEVCGDKHTLSDARAHIENKLVKHYEDHGFGYYIMSLKQSEDGRPLTELQATGFKGLPIVGSVGLTQRKSINVADLGYTMLPEYEGQGYATEAAQALLTYAVETLGKTEVIGLAEEKNIASVRVLRKIGLTYWGTLMLPDWDTESVVYALPGMKEIKVNEPPAPH